MSLATPEKIRSLQRKLYCKAKAEPAFRFYVLYDKICRADVLLHAYRLARANAGAAGVDGVSFAQIEERGLEAWLAGLREELVAKTYRPDPVRRVMIPKPDGGERPLGIPTIRDRVVQTAAKLVLEPIFEADFEDNAYGYRPRRGAVDAVKDVHRHLCRGYTDVVDADLSKYFDNIPHRDLMQSVARRIVDRNVLALIKMWLHALLWSVVNVFHRRIDRIERDLDDNERAQRSGQREQDGSEVRSVELERLVAQGLTLIERRNSFEFIRDAAAELYGLHTGQAWRPRTGSMVNRATMTAAMIDSREFINARRRADAQVLLPKGTRIAFAGGVEYSDHQRIWAVLDKVLVKHADMVLLHGGTPRGAEKIAACWADARKISQVVFKPDWIRHQKAAPFKRNDQLLEALPIGIVVFPGSGVTDNLADKAKLMGIPLFDFRKAGGA